MADILIKDIEIPKDGTLTLVIHSNHDVYLGTVVKDVKIGTAVEVPSHGRCVDADLLKRDLYVHACNSSRQWFYAEVAQFIDEAPTILETVK